MCMWACFYVTEQVCVSSYTQACILSETDPMREVKPEKEGLILQSHDAKWHGGCGGQDKSIGK